MSGGGSKLPVQPLVIKPLPTHTPYPDLAPRIGFNRGKLGRDSGVPHERHLLERKEAGRDFPQRDVHLPYIKVTTIECLQPNRADAVLRHRFARRSCVPQPYSSTKDSKNRAKSRSTS